MRAMPWLLALCITAPLGARSSPGEAGCRIATSKRKLEGVLVRLDLSVTPVTVEDGVWWPDDEGSRAGFLAFPGMEPVPVRWTADGVCRPSPVPLRPASTWVYGRVHHPNPKSKAPVIVVGCGGGYTKAAPNGTYALAVRETDGVCPIRATVAGAEPGMVVHVAAPPGQRTEVGRLSATPAIIRDLGFDVVAVPEGLRIVHSMTHPLWRNDNVITRVAGVSLDRVSDPVALLAARLRLGGRFEVVIQPHDEDYEITRTLVETKHGFRVDL